MPRLATTVGALLLTACAVGPAGAPGVECQGTSWYRLGYEDGLADARAELKKYATSCGSAFDEKQYQQGFQEGLVRRSK